MSTPRIGLNPLKIGIIGEPLRIRQGNSGFPKLDNIGALDNTKYGPRTLRYDNFLYFIERIIKHPVYVLINTVTSQFTPFT